MNTQFYSDVYSRLNDILFDSCDDANHEESNSDSYLDGATTDDHLYTEEERYNQVKTDWYHIHNNIARMLECYEHTFKREDNPLSPHKFEDYKQLRTSDYENIRSFDGQTVLTMYLSDFLPDVYIHDVLKFWGFDSVYSTRQIRSVRSKNKDIFPYWIDDEVQVGLFTGYLIEMLIMNNNKPENKEKIADMADKYASYLTRTTKEVILPVYKGLNNLTNINYSSDEIESVPRALDKNILCKNLLAIIKNKLYIKGIKIFMNSNIKDDSLTVWTKLPNPVEMFGGK